MVNIPADVEHWHGAAPDSPFTHIGITPKVSENTAQWLEPVTDEAYAEAVRENESCKKRFFYETKHIDAGHTPFLETASDYTK